MKTRNLWKRGKIPTNHIYERAGKWAHVLTGMTYGSQLEAVSDYWDCVAIQHDISPAHPEQLDETAERHHYGINN